DLVLGGDGNDTLRGNAGNDTIEGGDGDDVIIDTEGTNVLRGGAGNDTITGYGTLEGGTGNDTLVSNLWNSATTYLFNLGDGQDTISDYTYGNYADTLVFGAGIAAADVTVTRSGDDLIFRINAND